MYFSLHCYSMEVGDLDLFHAHTMIMNQTLSLVGVMSLKCAVELDIADIINHHGNPTSLSELARLIPIPREKDDMLRRLMCLLVARGVFSCSSVPGRDTAYWLTPFSKLLLRKGANLSAYVSALLDLALVQQPLLCTSAWFRSEGGSSPLELAHGRRIWELMGERSELNARFNDAMASNAMVVVKMIVAEHPEIFRGLTSLVDVGGGTGAAARAITTAFPKVNCTVLDLPHVVASNTLSAVNAVGGDMFMHIPPANAVFLKNVLLDWGDEDCVKILNRCKEAIPPREEGGKVIIVDKVVSSRPQDQMVTDTQLLYDVLMMVVTGGKEGNEDEWRKIFEAAGFQDYKILPLMGIHSVIELYP